MRFRRPTADKRSSARRGRLKQGPRRRAVLGAESLEPRQLLAAASITAGPAITGQEQTALTNVVAVINDPSATTADFTAAIDWGDKTPTISGTISATGQAGVFQVLGTHTYDEGTFTVRATIRKDNGTPTAVATTANITDPPLTATGQFTVSAVEGTSPGNQLLATFIDPAPDTTVAPFPYSASINWGDGSVTSGTISYDAALGQFVVMGGGNHIYTNPGSETITVTLTHNNLPSITVTDTALVTDPQVIAQGGFTFTGSEGATNADQKLATFVDPGGIETVDHYQATIDWGDGHTTSGTVQPAGGNHFSVFGTHSYVEEGTGFISVTVQHDATPPVTVSDAYAIADPPVVINSATLLTTEGALLSAAVATFVDPGGPEDVGDYTVQIDWGDNSSSPGIVTRASGDPTYTVTASHMYLTPGTQTATLTILHDAAGSAVAQTTISVVDPAVVATGGATFTAVEGASSPVRAVATFTDPGALDPISGYSATINWGDGTSATPGTISYDGGLQLFSVMAQHTYAEEGTFPITVTLGHDQAANVTVSATAVVSDPAVQAVGGASFSALEYRASAVQTLAVFSDPGGAEPASDYSATIRWGDGTSSNGTVVGQGPTFTVEGSHVYAAYGSYAPAITIHHDSAPDVTVYDSATVGVPPIQIASLPATWREWTVPVELSPLASLSFTDNQMTSTIDWGDGGTSAGVITPDMIGSAGTVRGSHMYTEAGNYTITITVNDAGQQTKWNIPTTILRELLPIPNPDAATPNQWYVAEAYGDILRRGVDGGGLRYWAGLLDQGVPRSVFTNSLLHSPEYLANFVISPAYEKYLGRAADPAGVRYWVGQMQGGLSDAGLIAALASSDEFFVNAGGNNLAYVAALYQNVLGRAADSAGQGYWAGQLAGGASRADVALRFATSSEDLSNLVNNDYQVLLDRTPTLDELNTAIGALSQGTLTGEGLIASIAATDEYFGRAQAE